MILPSPSTFSAVRIPNQFIKLLNLEEGAELQIIVTPENDILANRWGNTRSILA
jgi:antitoxin component of MazEF toxin-antitoxin module